MAAREMCAERGLVPLEHGCLETPGTWVSGNPLLALQNSSDNCLMTPQGRLSKFGGAGGCGRERIGPGTA